MSTFEDCQKFLNFVAECFVEKPVTMDQVRLQKLRTATAACRNLNEDPPIKVPNADIDKVDEKEKPTDASRRGFVHRESNNHRGAYTLTNIYIYPIKSCGAHEVWRFPKSFFLSLISVSPCVWIRSCAALHSGPRLAGGAAGFTLRQKLDGGEWKRRVPQSEEGAAFMPHSPTSPPVLKQITPAGVRLDNMLVAQWKKTGCFAKRYFHLWIIIFKDLFFFCCPAGMETISVPLEHNSTMHTSYQACQSKVCGDRWAGSVKTCKGGSWRKHCETNLLSCLSLISDSAWLCLSIVDGDIRPPALSFIWILSVIYYFNKRKQCWSDDNSHKLQKKPVHPVILGLDVTANRKHQDADFPWGVHSLILLLPPGWRLSTVGMRLHRGFLTSLGNHVAW